MTDTNNTQTESSKIFPNHEGWWWIKNPEGQLAVLLVISDPTEKRAGFFACYPTPNKPIEEWWGHVEGANGEWICSAVAPPIKSEMQTEGVGCGMLDITISGMPGAGKSHLARWLAKMLHSQGMKVILDDAGQSLNPSAQVELDRVKTITVTTEIE